MAATLDLSRAPAPPGGGPVVNLAGLTREGLKAALIEAGVVAPDKARMRAGQIWRWIHHYGVTDFDEMSDIAKETRARLADAFVLPRPRDRRAPGEPRRRAQVADPLRAGRRGRDGVHPRRGPGGALCVSSQVGCTLNCSFCHTGTQALVRNLTAAEIIAQVQVARDDLGEWPPRPGGPRLSNIVFMGMGEPLYNLDNVADAIDIISDNEGIAHLAPADHRLDLRRGPRADGAGRTHPGHAGHLAARHQRRLRDELVPLNRRYPIAELMAAIRAYPGLSNARRVTFEYVMLKGVNDTPGRRPRAGAAARGRAGQDQPDPVQSLAGRAVRVLGLVHDRGLRRDPEPRPATPRPIRTPRGRDILAACGQLKSESEKLRASALRAMTRTA